MTTCLRNHDVSIGCLKDCPFKLDLWFDVMSFWLRIPFGHSQFYLIKMAEHCKWILQLIIDNEAIRFFYIAE